METNLIAMTVRLTPQASSALSKKAYRAGLETADYAADTLTAHVLEELRTIDPDEAERAQAELELKAAVLRQLEAYLREHGFDASVTLKLFRLIRSDDRLHSLYRKAIGNKPGDDRDNPIKARINRNFGAAIKTAARATPQKINGHPIKAQVSGEFIQTYTLLEPDNTKNA